MNFTILTTKMNQARQSERHMLLLLAATPGATHQPKVRLEQARGMGAILSGLGQLCQRME